MPPPVLLVDKSDGLATLTLNRPEALNALSQELRRAVAATFRELEEDAGIRVVILTGAGRAFCAGLDLKELSQGSAASGDSRLGDDGMLDAIASFTGPVIGAVNGFAITGGFELALACDVLVASSAARFADTHARVGILPGWGLSQKLSRMIGISRAKELSFTGNYLEADRAERWGLVSRVVAPDELLPACIALAQDMLSCVPDTLSGYKRVIDAGYRVTFGEGMELESKAARENARGVSADDIAARRSGVQSRGRRQSGAD